MAKDCLHSPGFNLLEHRSFSCLWIRSSSCVVHPSLCRSWCNLRRYHCSYDLSFYVYGDWESSLHAYCTSGWKTSSFSFLTPDIDWISGGGRLRKRLSHALGSAHGVGICCWPVRSTCSHDDPGLYSRHCSTFFRHRANH